jgi:hypothetical protein
VFFSLEQMVDRDETYQASVVLDQLRGFTDEAKQSMMCAFLVMPPPQVVTLPLQRQWRPRKTRRVTQSVDWAGYFKSFPKFLFCHQ